MTVGSDRDTPTAARKPAMSAQTEQRSTRWRAAVRGGLLSIIAAAAWTAIAPPSHEARCKLELRGDAGAPSPQDGHGGRHRRDWYGTQVYLLTSATVLGAAADAVAQRGDCNFDEKGSEADRETRRAALRAALTIDHAPGSASAHLTVRAQTSHAAACALDAIAVAYLAQTASERALTSARVVRPELSSSSEGDASETSQSVGSLQAELALFRVELLAARLRVIRAQAGVVVAAETQPSALPKPVLGQATNARSEADAAEYEVDELESMIAARERSLDALQRRQLAERWSERARVTARTIRNAVGDLSMPPAPPRHDTFEVARPVEIKTVGSHIDASSTTLAALLGFLAGTLRWKRRATSRETDDRSPACG